MIKCPHCAHNMEEKLSVGITIDQCTSCKGLWFDNKELTAFCIMAGYNREKVEGALNYIEVLHQADTVFCPRCDNQKLYHAKTRGINILTCKHCNGVYLHNKTIVNLLQQFADKNKTTSSGSGPSFMGDILGFGLEEIISDILDW